MDANGTRYHLLLGRHDWARARTGGGVPLFDATGEMEWDDQRDEVTLWRETFRFTAKAGDRPVSIADRRGAAGDRFGNWYWISPDTRSILVYSAGSGNTSTFWPPPEQPNDTPVEDGSFGAIEPPAIPRYELQGLAVTEDHYLVAGTLRPGGLLIFDLYSPGPPRQRLWPFAFAPFDMVARRDGGVWVLDADARRVWELDRRFDVVASGPPLTATDDDATFASAEPVTDDRDVQRMRVLAEHAWPIAAADAIAIEAFDNGVLVLERDGGDGFAAVHWLVAGAQRGARTSTRDMLKHVDVEHDEAPFTLVAHDFALGARDAEDPPGWRGRLYIANGDGNQAFAFGVAINNEQLELLPLPDYYPIRLFGGRALVAVNGEPWYDCADRWVRLVQQNRPRYADDGELWSPVFDSGEPDCVWHRLLLDACIPPTAGIEVHTRAANDWRELTLTQWLTPAEKYALGAADEADIGAAATADDLLPWQREPDPYMRGDGAELPFLPRPAGAHRGTFELLLQRARGRYIQIRLVFRGNGRNTPRVRALRVWYPRFSYADRYLPAVYREDADSASFLERFLANTEGMFTAIEDRIAAAQLLFDVESAPPETLAWLASWFGVALDPRWQDHRRRLFIRHAMEFFAMRGTVRGIQTALRLALDDCVDDRLFDGGAAARRTSSVRIIERFRARTTPHALLGDVTTALSGPQLFDPNAQWRPTAGAAQLHQRYRAALTLAAGTLFPLVPPADRDRWTSFAERTLGFVPAAGAAERARWQKYLQSMYTSVSALNTAHGTAWGLFTDPRLPANQPATAAARADWRAFQNIEPQRERRLWQSFLARRYRNVAALNREWRTSWPAFAEVALHDTLPTEPAQLHDWFRFEGTALTMHRFAHRFTVMLAIPKQLRADTPSQQRRLRLAETVIDLEKPAHTVYDVRYYWAMFRLGEARLGDDTVVDLGSRAPELMSPLVLGERYLAESYLAAHEGHDAPLRMQLGRDRIDYSARIGGP